MDIMKASNQWATRPNDERFWNLEEAHAATLKFAQDSVEVWRKYNSLKAVASGDEVLITAGKGEAEMTNWSFKQLCSRASAPPSYISTLPAQLAADCINTGLEKVADDSELQLYIANPSELTRPTIRSITTERYNRKYNHDFITRLMQLQDIGFKIPPARPAGLQNERTKIATPEDCPRCSIIKPGDVIAPAGIYASDHDMFTIMVNDSNPIKSATGHELSRFFMFWNSEVGAKSYGFMIGLLDYICGNHILWNCSEVVEGRFSHIGDKYDLFSNQLEVELIKYSNDSATEIEGKIEFANRKEIAATKDEVINTLFGMRSLGLSRKVLESAYSLTEQHEDTDGNPRSYWGMAQGLTRASQLTGYTDERTAIDKAAAKVIDLAF